MPAERLTPDDIPRRAGLQRLIAEALHEIGRDASPTEIANLLGKEVQDIQNGLTRMKGNGRAEQVNHGLWRLGTRPEAGEELESDAGQTITLDLDVMPGEFKTEMGYVLDDNGQIERYIMIKVIGLTKEQGEEVIRKEVEG